MTLSVGLQAAEAEEPDTGLTTRTAALDAPLTHALTEDWALDAGFRAFCIYVETYPACRK